MSQSELRKKSFEEVSFIPILFTAPVCHTSSQAYGIFLNSKFKARVLRQNMQFHTKVGNRRDKRTEQVHLYPTGYNTIT